MGESRCHLWGTNAYEISLTCEVLRDMAGMLEYPTAEVMTDRSSGRAATKRSVRRALLVCIFGTGWKIRIYHIGQETILSEVRSRLSHLLRNVCANAKELYRSHLPAGFSLVDTVGEIVRVVCTKDRTLTAVVPVARAEVSSPVLPHSVWDMTPSCDRPEVVETPEYFLPL